MQAAYICGMKIFKPVFLIMFLAACGGKKQADGVRSPYRFDKSMLESKVKAGQAIYNAEKTPEGNIADEQYYLGDTVKYELRYTKEGKLDFVLKRREDGTFQWQELYYPNGQRKAKYGMKGFEGIGSRTGVYHGPFEKYYENGYLQTKGEYVQDKLAWSINFDQNGKAGDTTVYERAEAPKK